MPCKLLIVDDLRDQRELLSMALRTRGFEVTAVPSCYEAMREVERAAREGEPFIAAIFDCAMQYIDGMTCAQQVRLNERLRPNTKPLRIAFYSAHERDLDFRELFKDVGAERDFHKPKDTAHIHDLVAEWLSDEC